MSRWILTRRHSGRPHSSAAAKWPRDRELVERAIAKAGGNSALAATLGIAPAQTSRWGRTARLPKIARRALELYLGGGELLSATAATNGARRRRATDRPPLREAIDAITALLDSTPPKRRARVAAGVMAMAEVLREVAS